MLSEEQKREAALILSIGGDRETAAAYLGHPVEELNAAAREDSEFAKALSRASAGAELGHMRCVQQASQDPKNWRASVWWLERRAPERYARRDAESVGRRDLRRFLAGMAQTIAAAVRDEEDRALVLERVRAYARQTPEPLPAPPHDDTDDEPRGDA